MARSVLAEGRALDAARMIEPLIRADLEPSDAGDVVLRCLMARIRLLRYGDAAGVLDLLGPFEEADRRQSLPPGARAEVALWLGFARVWQDDEQYDDARALNLLDEAARGFCEDMSAAGRCWTLIAQAHAYFTIDEYQLMLQALEEAAALQEKLSDVQAAMWIAGLSVVAARYQGRHRDAEHYASQLRALAKMHDDGFSLGKAAAYAAVVAYEKGVQPEEIIQSAREAIGHLMRASTGPGYPLLSAYHAWIGALVRQGSWDEAERLIDEALSRVGHLRTGRAYIELHRVRIRMYRGDLDHAEREIGEIHRSMQRQHRLLHSNVARVQSELMLRRKRVPAARESAERAYRNAREAGHGGYELLALLQLARVAVLKEDAGEVRRFIREMEKHGHFLSLLPFAAEQFALQARLAIAQSHETEARAYLTQALSAWSMVGDVFGMATAQYELARLIRTSSPAECRALAEAALRTFSELGVQRETRRLRDLVRALPGEDDETRQLSEADIAAVLSRSALSIDLVAETWLRLAEKIAPQRWMGVFRYDESAGWSTLRAHGALSDPIIYPDATADRLCEGGVDWIRLKGTPSPAFFFGMECGGEDDPACRVIEKRLSAWAPVAGLAMEHALLRGAASTSAVRERASAYRHAGSLDGLVYSSDSMRRVAEKIEQLRSSHSPVFITGESGVGKSVVAQSIHSTSDRAEGRFIVFDCTSVTREDCYTRLFGQIEPRGDGATDPANSAGATAGAVQEAEDGTLFIDHIDKLPADVQPHLLRFLERGDILPAGASSPEKANVRIIAAAQCDVRELIRAGRFREDLYLRLKVISLRVPPLRERKEEIPLLVQHFLRTLPAAHARRTSLSGRALEAMIHYDWPGNVRQLRNEIERVLVFTGSEPAPMIDIDDLSEPISRAAAEQAHRDSDLSAGASVGGTDLDDILAGAEKAVIERMLADKEGHVSATAEALGLSRQGLYKKMKRLGIDSSRFQPDKDASTLS